MPQLEREIPGLLVGRAVLIVIDLQRDVVLPSQVSGINRAEGHAEVIARAEQLVAAARAGGVPIIFFQEAHRATGVDFGRELDGNETVHCLEDDPSTALWPTFTPRQDRDHHEYMITKRRYSAFFGTDLQILLNGLRAETLVLIGNLTDVCVHYTFADAHQHDYRVRVVEDCVIGSSVERHNASLDAMEYLQHGARRSTDEVVSAFLEFSGYEISAPIPELPIPDLTEVGR